MNLLGGEPSYIAKIAQSVAEGNLSVDLTSHVADQGAFAQMKAMVASLRDKIGLAEQIAAGEQLSQQAFQLQKMLSKIKLHTV